MKVADRPDVCGAFFKRLARAPSRALLLDYDGTLAPFTTDRTRSFPYPEVTGLIAQIMRRGTRVVLISGRPATQLLFLSGLNPHPEIWGSHGAERLHADGCYEADEIPADRVQALRIAENSLQASGLAARTEKKPGGLAVHWRGLSHEERVAVEHRVRTLWTAPVRDYGLQVLSFDGGLELRASGTNKGDVVAVILAELGPEASVAYLGDDQTDENAFRAIKGRGLAVLVRPEPRPTQADAWLVPPEQLRRFLRGWLAACGAETYEAAGRVSR